MGKKNGLVRRAGEEKRMDSNNIHLCGKGVVMSTSGVVDRNCKIGVIFTV